MQITYHYNNREGELVRLLWLYHTGKLERNVLTKWENLEEFESLKKIGAVRHITRLDDKGNVKNIYLLTEFGKELCKNFYIEDNSSVLNI